MTRSPRHRAPAAPLAASPFAASPLAAASTFSRRGALALVGAGAGALAVSQPAQAGTLSSFAARTGKKQRPVAPSAFPGHRPGLTYLGISSPETIESREKVLGRLGVQRSFYQWTGGTGEDRTIRADHAAGRLPWISFKPPTGAPSWAAVGGGSYDGDIRVRARRYAGYSKPVVVTFHHEPTNDSSDGAAWSRAFVRIHDVMKAETGLKNVAFAPIVGEWAFNPKSRSTTTTPAFLTPAVLDRMAFLGIDCYQNSSGEGYDVRLGRVLAWLNASGHSDAMIGIGETGATDTFRNVTAVQWWERQWAWVARNSARVPVVSYFDSPLNSKATVAWPLQESAGKLAAYKRSLASSTSCRLA